MAWIRYGVMLVACLLVGAACSVTFYLFTRRLRRIQEELWGEKAREKSQP